jgi:HAD superfamily hydrolase (TIGR01509 family)
MPSASQPVGPVRDVLVPRLKAVRAVVFDTDGVILDSARVHAAAWKAAFDVCLGEPGDGQRPFDAREDYRRHVDGKSRFDGARAFLDSRGVDLPPGEPGDEPGCGTVWAVAARKEAAFTAALAEHGIEAWPGTVRLLRALRAEGVPFAAVSASRHARDLLGRAGVLPLFATVVDGNDAARRHLPGKPDPALFLEAAARLGVAPEEAAVVEDALAGVEAGRRGGFGLVVGVDRVRGPETAADLRNHGAVVVVTDLAELLDEPAGAEDGAAGPHAAGPHAAGAKAAGPGAAGSPGTAGPEAAGPETARPEAAGPEATEHRAHEPRRAAPHQDTDPGRAHHTHPPRPHPDHTHPEPSRPEHPRPEHPRPEHPRPERTRRADRRGHGPQSIWAPEHQPHWMWEYEGYDPARERLREALCTLGNGYFATRGAAPETDADDVHYPGTYIAGLYNRLVSTVAGREVENEDMVNLPNWLPLRYRPHPYGTQGGPWLTPDDPGLTEYRQRLDLRTGILHRTLVYAVPGGGRLRVEQDRFVHMADPHLAGMRTEFTAEDWAGELEVESALDGAVGNTGVARYRELDGSHLSAVHTGVTEPDTNWLWCRTITSDVRIALAARTRATPPVQARPHLTDRGAAQFLTLPLTPGATAAVEKTAALHTSRDHAISDPLGAAVDRVTRAPAIADGLLDSHRTAWEHLWRRAELEVPGEAGRILHLHQFHVLQTLSPHSAGLDVGVPARGLHGEAYRGHVFWDELFVLPYLNLHCPEVSRALLEYRHRRLPAACRAAADAGRRGARYPWQSGSDGREETQELHLNPRSGRWLPDHSRLQHHVGSAVAYNVWQYCQASGDTEFLHTKGAEMVLQIARYWASAAVLDTSCDRYRICCVVGPDEYHEAYPGATEPGLDDNAYTNVTAAWVLCRALDLAATLPEPRRRELLERIRLDEDELALWDDVSRRLRVPFHRDAATGERVISQFEGYGELAELDWDGYRARYGDIRRLDRILEAEGDTVNRYQASKQADVLMLGYLFSTGELCALLRHMGYGLDAATWRRTVDYYLHRTSHGSTLSGLVHAWVLARVRREDAWTYGQEALIGDVADVQGGTTPEGIHLGAMAGTLDLVQRGLTGMETREDALWLDPVPLPELSEFGFSMRYRGHWGVGLHVRGERLRISVPDSDESPIDVVLRDRSLSVAPGQSRSLRLRGGGRAAS